MKASPNIPHRLYKRTFLLLEVLIAFLLVVLCAIPLIAPHVTIFRDQNAFLDRIELDYAINEEYAKIIEQLYRQNIPWENIATSAKVKIEKYTLKASDGHPLPFEGHYTLSVPKKKPSEDKPFTVNLLKLSYKIKPQKSDGKEISYEYDIFLPRQLSGETPEADKDGKDGKDGKGGGK